MSSYPADLYNTPSNYRVPLARVLFKVGTMPSGQYFVRKKDLKYSAPGNQIKIFGERYDNGTRVLIEECRATGVGQLWVCQKF